MAISANIERSYINMFKSGWEQSFQQTMAKFRPFVETVSQSSEFDFYDRVGLADDMNEVTARYGDTPSNEVGHERRRIGLTDYDWGKGVDDKDLIRVAQDPTNEYTQAAVASANRRIDRTIINAITGTSYLGKSGGTSATFAVTASGKITVGSLSNENGNLTTAGDYAVTAGNVEGIDVAVNYTPGGGGSSSNITLNKMIAVREAMLSLEAIEEGEELVWFAAPSQQSALLRITDVKSADYNTTRVLTNGTVTSFMGFKFVYTNLLPKSGNIRSNYVLGKKGVKLAISRDTQVDIFRRPDKKNIPWIMVKLGLGATRMWGEHTARVNCDETA